MITLADERKLIEDGIKMIKKSQLDITHGTREMLGAMEKAYDDIRSAGLQMKSAKYREKLSKDCKFFGILIELIGQALQGAANKQEQGIFLERIYLWYKQNSGKLQLADRPVFHGAQEASYPGLRTKVTHPSAVVIPIHGGGDLKVTSRPQTRAATSTSLQETAVHAATSQAASDECVISALYAHQECPTALGSDTEGTAPSVAYSSAFTEGDGADDLSPPPASPPCPAIFHAADDNSFIETVTAANLRTPSVPSRVISSKGQSQRRLPLVSVAPVNLEVNKVIGHPSDVYPELFTQLLIGSYVADMDTTAQRQRVNSSTPKWHHQSLEEFLVSSEIKQNLLQSEAKRSRSSRRDTTHWTNQDQKHLLSPIVKTGKEASTEGQRVLPPAGLPSSDGYIDGKRVLHLGEVVGMADFASAEISYEKTVDMHLAGSAIGSGIIQPSFSVLSRRGAATPRREASLVPGATAQQQKEDGGGDMRYSMMSRSSNHHNSSKDTSSESTQSLRQDRNGSCHSHGRLIRNSRAPLGKPEDAKIPDGNERVPEASSHHTTEVDQSVMSKLFQVQRIGRRNLFQNAYRYQADRYFDPSLPLLVPKEEREVSFHDEFSYCYYDDPEDKECEQDSKENEKQKEYISFVTSLSSAMKSALQSKAADGGSRCTPETKAEENPTDEKLQPSEAAWNEADEQSALFNENVEYPEDTGGADVGGEATHDGLPATADERPLTVTPSSRSPPTSAKATFLSAGMRNKARLIAPTTLSNTASEKGALDSLLVAARFDSRSSHDAVAGSHAKRTFTNILHRRPFAHHRTSPSIPVPYVVSTGAEHVDVPRKVFIPELERAARNQTQSFDYIAKVNSLRSLSHSPHSHDTKTAAKNEQCLDEALLITPAFMKLSA